MENACAVCDWCVYWVHSFRFQNIVFLSFASSSHLFCLRQKYGNRIFCLHWIVVFFSNVDYYCLVWRQSSDTLRCRDATQGSLSVSRTQKSAAHEAVAANSVTVACISANWCQNKIKITTAKNPNGISCIPFNKFHHAWYHACMYILWHAVDFGRRTRLRVSVYENISIGKKCEIFSKLFVILIFSIQNAIIENAHRQIEWNYN